MVYKDYQQDLMDNYGSIDRKWKLDGNKLIRLNGKNEEQYFYDLYHSEKNGIFGTLEEISRFNLVVGTNVVQLNLWYRYKLLSLIGLKKDNITKLNRVKKQMSDFEKLVKKGAHRTVEGGKQIANAIRNQGPNPAGIIGEVLERKRETNKFKGLSEKPRIKPAPTSPHKFDYESLKERYQLQLKLELENQRCAQDLTKQEVESQKTKFQQRLEEMAKRRMENSVNINDISDRFRR